MSTTPTAYTTRTQTFFLTRAGLRRFRGELQDLQTARLVRVKNFDEEQDEVRLLDQKIEHVSDVLSSYELISLPPKEARDIVGLGATVTVDVGGHVSDLTIVGTAEANPLLGRVSDQSPVGKALIGCRAGDVVTLASPLSVAYEVVRVRYG